jgi:SAM-dependent methyltransferase
MESNVKSTYWEVVANTSWGGYVAEVEKRAILKANALAANPTTCLEIGCEGGRWSKLLADLGWSVTCTDVDPETLKICKERIPTAHCMVVKPNDTSIPSESNSVSLLLCIEVPPVMHSQWFLAEAFRVLQTNGILVGVFLNRLSLRGLWAHITARLRNSYEYYKLVYPRWRNELRKNGFRVVY